MRINMSRWEDHPLFPFTSPISVNVPTWTSQTRRNASFWISIARWAKGGGRVGQSVTQRRRQRIMTRKKRAIVPITIKIALHFFLPLWFQWSDPCSESMLIRRSRYVRMYECILIRTSFFCVEYLSKGRWGLILAILFHPFLFLPVLRVGVFGPFCVLWHMLMPKC